VTNAEASVTGLLSELAQDRPGDVAFVLGEDTRTFQELHLASARVAAALYAQGVREGDAVAAWLVNCPAFVELQFALARLGAVMICVNTRYRSHELSGVLTRARARWLAMAPRFRGIDFASILEDVDDAVRGRLSGVILCGAQDVPDAVAGIRTIDYAALAAADADMQPATGDVAGSPCVAFASSGSTGVPKLIVHSQRGIVEHARAVAASFFGSDDTVALVTLPLTGVFGYVTLIGALAGGRRSIVMEAFDPERAVELIERHRATILTGPDEIMLRTLEAAAETPDRIASWREGGFGYQSVDSAALVEHGDQLGVSLYGCYGSSECLGLMSHQPREAPAADRALAGGVPASSAQRIRVRSAETGELQPPGATGLLEISGPSVMVGYLHQPDATRAAFTDDGWFKTGDIGYQVPDSDRFVFLARANDILRLAGFLVEPQEIESFIERLDGIAAAQVVEVSTDAGARAVAFVVATAGAPVAEDDVIDHCAASLAKYKVPVRVFVVDSFPRTTSPNGEKVQRGRLRERAHELLGLVVEPARS
jgi:fatty-acyl-CoA synthase